MIYLFRFIFKNIGVSAENTPVSTLRTIIVLYLRLFRPAYLRLVYAKVSISQYQYMLDKNVGLGIELGVSAFLIFKGCIPHFRKYIYIITCECVHNRT